MKITIGAFILQQLRTLSIDRIYGVPGDYNLALLELIEQQGELEFIGNCNELNASYAADGYARLGSQDRLAFIEVKVPMMDTPPVMKEFCNRCNNFNFGLTNPRRA